MEEIFYQAAVELIIKHVFPKLKLYKSKSCKNNQHDICVSSACICLCHTKVFKDYLKKQTKVQTYQNDKVSKGK